MTPVKTFVALFDLHVGQERVKVTGGEWLTRPTHDLSLLRTVMSFVTDFSPDVFILGGDQLNCGPISHWHNGKPVLVEGLRLKKEYDLLDREVLNKVQKIKEKVWLPGNHEQWLSQHAEKNPGLIGMIEPENYLRLQERKWTVFSHGLSYRLGKLYFHHGDVLSYNKKMPKNHADTFVRTYRRNLRYGHAHSFAGATDVTPMDVSAQHTAISVPALCRRDLAYANGVPNAANQGFLYGYVRADGSFNDYVVFATGGRFTVEGKTWGKNK